MKKIYKSKLIFIFLLGMLATSAVAQNVQLVAEDFETPSFTFFTLNTAGPGGGSGVNRWIINDSYSGTLPYPNTPPQDSTVSGQIGGAPSSRYMHIYDSGFGLSQGDTNACYDPAQPSDIFTELSGNMCTLGMINVTMAFFYSCVGSPTAYGTLYYSANGGPWTQVGQSQYNSTNIWQYEAVTDPAFDNVANLKFGFRWQNNSSGSDPVTRSFAVDDVQVVGTFNSAGVTLSIDSVWPNPICPNRYLFLEWSLSQPLCNGTYMYEMSDFTGNFANPVSLGVININNGQVAGINAVFIPAATFPGNCYQIRLRRMYPAPIFVGTPSSCFVVQFCPNTITTLGTPVIAMDTNAVCAGSVIDVSFYSTGTFILNTYKLQLSDKYGNFVHPDSAGALFLGSLPPPTGNVTFDPMNPTPGYPPPGSVSGLIPDTVSESCLYRIRVIGTGPAAGPPGPVIGTDWGPFCIQHCDIITNNEQDISFCLWPEDTICVQLEIDINFYDSNAVYQPGNQFMVQVISRGPIPPPFTLVGTTGALGTFTFNNDTTILQWCISYALLAQTGIPPGSYYMRIVATNSSIGADSAFGSMIRLTIGAPNPIPGSINAVDWITFQPVDTICSGDLVYFYLSPPPNPSSTYYWHSNQLQGSPVVQNAILVNFANFSGVFTVYVTENSFGCFGPPTPAITIYVMGLPNVAISLPAVACVGDTVQYSVPFFPNTYWTWWLSDTTLGTIIDTSNNTITVVFHSAGSDTIFVQGLNTCGTRLGLRRIIVRDYPVLLNNPDTTICSGNPVTFIAPVAPSFPPFQYQWKQGTSIISTNDTLTVSPGSTTTYLLAVSNGGFCYSYDTMLVIVEQPPVTDFSDSLCIGSTLTLDATTASANSYLWNDSSTNAFLTISDSGTYSAHVFVTGEVCYRQYDYTITYSYPDTTSDSTSICIGTTTVLTAQSSGAGYLWNTGDTTNQITVSDSGQYTVSINDTTRLCPRIETYYVSLGYPDTTLRLEAKCTGATLELSAQDSTFGNSYSWSTGASTDSIRVTSPGVYSVIISNPSWLCPKIANFDISDDPNECTSDYNLPNVFTPDNSGANDLFQACSEEWTTVEQQVKCPPYKNIKDVVMKIFNRWGELVFETTDRNINWNGKKNNSGTDCPDGVYYYTCLANYIFPVNGEPSKDIHGFITLIRKK
ncbi:MAG TPA: gliding motility-associated C-terminal domain-containing protein [Bacteroidia bacterium]|nr:gliding motility-associated C-terminal domain-containing protein [Bacteroidia bacterium]